MPGPYSENKTFVGQGLGLGLKYKVPVGLG